MCRAIRGFNGHSAAIDVALLGATKRANGGTRRSEFFESRCAIRQRVLFHDSADLFRPARDISSPRDRPHGAADAAVRAGFGIGHE
jgi:hypothetical protein